MNTHKPSFKDTLTIGLMLFALYFGAGNLIFPSFLGQNAGSNVWIAVAGFLITGVGLPLLCFLSLALSGKDDVQQLADGAGKLFGLIFSIILYLAIGPFFAIPRTGNVSFEIGVHPFVPAGSEKIALFVFTILFFTLTYFLARNPGKIVDVIGKYLAPIKLTLILIIIGVAIAWPMGAYQAPIGDYDTKSFFNSFQQGYLTLDTIASFAFGMVVLQAVRAKGAKTKKEVTSMGIKASLISMVLLMFIYGSLAYMGATSVSQIGYVENGAQVLAKVSAFYFGTYGNLVLGITIIVSCLTTSVGLTVATASFFNKIYPKIAIKRYVLVIAIFSAIIANLGLTQLLAVSMPVLMVIYPMVICLVILVLTNGLHGGSKPIYQLSMFFTFCVSLFDGFKTAGWDFASGIQAFYAAYLPWDNVGLGWIIPALCGGILGYIITRIKGKTTET